MIRRFFASEAIEEVGEINEINIYEVNHVNLKNKIHDRIITNRNDDSQRDKVNAYLNEQNKKYNELIKSNSTIIKPKINLLRPNEEIGEQIMIAQDYDNTNYLIDEQFEELLNQLNLRDKLRLYKKIKIDLGFKGTNEIKLNENYYNKLTLLDKIEIIIIFLIKLNFLILRYSIPISKKIYNKFYSNNIYLLNYYNFNKFLNLIIGIMNTIEIKFHEEIVDDIENNHFNNPHSLDPETLYYNKDKDKKSFSWNLMKFAMNDFSLLDVAEDFVKQMTDV